MDVADEELAKLGAVLVEERVLRRIIKVHRRIKGVGLQVPHEHNYSIAKVELEKLAEKGDLAVELGALPDRVVLVSGDRAAIVAGTPEALTKLWRSLFHARIHQRFDELFAAHRLTPAAVRQRVHRVGQTEFDEIRTVLKQEDLLLPPIDDTAIYIEFVALYLELTYFAPSAVDRTFPAVFDTAHIDAAIRQDLDPAVELAASRPARAPEQPLVIAPEPIEAKPQAKLEHADPSARKRAVRARKRGNRSRAAILAMRAGDRPGAREDLDELGNRLAKSINASTTAGWTEALLPLAEVAGAQRSLRFNPGVRLLHDLQAACTVAEREVKVVDLVTWAISLGKRPVVRPLPATREVRIAKRLHSAAAKLPECGLQGEDRERLAKVLHQITDRADDQVRLVVRPKIEAALDEVGLHPHSLPERVAEKKLVDELLDRAVAVGRLTLGDLRDTLSSNDLKLPNLDVRQLKGGDQLLKCDEILSQSLDGVYRRGESYMRFLQKLSSLLFGTPIGRFLTLYLILPYLGSFAVVEGLQHTVGVLVHKIWHVEPQISTRTTQIGGAIVLFLLLHLRFVRQAAWWGVRILWWITRFLIIDVPIAFWRKPFMRRFLASRVTRWVIKPALPALIPLLFFHQWWKWIVVGGVFVVTTVVMNSRYGRLAEEIGTDWLVRSGRQVRTRFLPGLVKATLDLFARLLDLLDRGIYRVDNWLRFRTGQNRIVMAFKGLLGVFWFFITYFLRLYVNLFVEPTTNPIKHFPVVTVAAKIILPFSGSILSAVAGPAKQLLGPAMGNGFAGFTLLVLPGLAGFLVWELKENWKLYRATRSKGLRPLAIGHHGESIASFLRPGFHSGTIPKLYTKLRRAAWRGDERGVARARDGLHHVEEAVAKFADRQLVSMLNEVAAFRANDVALEHVEIGSNRLQITIVCPSIGSEPATIRMELQSGWIVAGIATVGWIDKLVDQQRSIFEIALAGFYKLSAIDIVREQVEQALKPAPEQPAPPYDIADEGLVVWPGTGFETEAIYDLRSNKLVPEVRGLPYEGTLFDLGGRHALFGREPLYWSIWSTTWQQIARGEEPMPIIVGPGLLPGHA